MTTRVALAVLERIRQPEFLENVRHANELFAQHTQRLCTKHEVTFKGIGLLLGLQLPSRVLVDKVVAECFARKVLVVSAAGNVLRLVPPLNVTGEEIAFGCEVLEEVVGSVAGTP